MFVWRLAPVQQYNQRASGYNDFVPVTGNMGMQAQGSTGSGVMGGGGVDSRMHGQSNAQGGSGGMSNQGSHMGSSQMPPSWTSTQQGGMSQVCRHVRAEMTLSGIATGCAWCCFCVFMNCFGFSDVGMVSLLDDDQLAYVAFG